MTDIWTQIRNFKVANIFLSYQGFIVNIASESIEENNGFELTSFPDGVPSLSNYLADYCSAAVRPNFLCLC